MSKITWSNKIQLEMEKNEDSWDNLVSLPETKWLWDDITDWKAIKSTNKAVIWTLDYIYFRVWENDTVVIRSIPRNPDPDFELIYFGESN